MHKNFFFLSARVKFDHIVKRNKIFFLEHLYFKFAVFKNMYIYCLSIHDSLHFGKTHLNFNTTRLKINVIVLISHL